MCGIAGIVYNNRKRNYLSAMEKMLNLVKHRGPDGHGIYESDNIILGHTRLAVIELSSSGQQPMIYRERLVITFNGEIYNYIELREKLSAIGYIFASKSDTEVILAAYLEWGENCLDYLNGMFAFGIYDLLEKKLFLARDRLGEKPLYYHLEDDELFFFSEPKQVIVSQLIEAIPNENSIYEYLEYQFSLSNQTFFKGIFKLLPGHCATFKDGSIEIRQYWRLGQEKIDYTVTYDEAKIRIRDLVADALRIRLRSDVKIASYLSGGIDSTVLASLAAIDLPNLSTFTFISKNYPAQDESAIAHQTAKLIGTDHHEIEMEYKDLLTLWHDSIYFMDEPEVGYSLLSQMVLSREVAKNTKVVIGGQGGNELFFGYGWYNILLLSSLLIKIIDFSLLNKLKVLFRFLLNNPIKYSLKAIISVALGSGYTLKDKYIVLWKSYGCSGLLKKHRPVIREPINQKNSLGSLKQFELTFWLHGLLHVEDRSSMASGLESRVPLLDHRLVQYVCTLPPHFMIDGVLNKKIFIDAFRDVLPKHVRNVKKKRGFVSPIQAWLKEPRVAKFIRDILENEDSYIFQFLDSAKINSKNVSERQIWMLISLEIWHRLFIKKQVLGCAQ